MGDVLLSDRWAQDRDLPGTVTRRAAGQARAQVMELLAGVLTEDPPAPERVPRPVTDLLLEFG